MKVPRLPGQVEFVLKVLYDHFMRTGQRRSWVVDGEENIALLAHYKSLDLYEFVRYQGRHQVLITGIGIEYVRHHFGMDFRMEDTGPLSLPGSTPLAVPDATVPALTSYIDAFETSRHVNTATAGECYWYLKALLGLDRWQPAEQVVAGILSRFPEDIDLAYLAGRVLFRAGRLREYHRHLGALAERFPDHPGVSLELAKLLLGARDPQLAAKYLQLAREGEPLHPEVLLNLGFVRFFQNEFPEAEVYLRRFLEVRPALPTYDLASAIVPSFLAICERCRGEQLNAVHWEQPEAVLRLRCGEKATLVRVPLGEEGEELHLLLDTGGGLLLSLDPQVCRRLGGEELTRLTPFGIGGQHQATVPVYRLPNLPLGGVRLSQALALGLDLSPFSEVLGLTLDGVFSPGSFLACHWTVDLAQAKLRLRPAPVLPPAERIALGGAAVSYPTSNEQHLRVSMFLLPDSKPILPLTIHGSEYWFFLDSGADRSIISRRLFERHVPAEQRQTQTVESVGIGEGLGVMEVHVTAELSYQIGEVPLSFAPCISLPHLESEVSNRLGFEVGGILGNDFIQEFDRVEIDFRNAEVLLVREME